MNFQKIGINQALTFPGFCNKHDTEIFREIETESIDFKNYKTNLLFSYKTKLKIVIGRPVGDVGNDILQLLNNTKFPEGVEYLPESDLKFQDDAFVTLSLAILIAIVLVYPVMVALYESYMHPLVVLFSIPLSVIGALFALALTQEAISIFSILGMLMLIGLVTKNVILVVDFINRLRKDGMIRTRAIVKGVKLRIRPILMTAISTIVGMLPIALSQAAGSEWKNGLGWTLIGGMTSSMLLSVIVVPVVYNVFENLKSRIIKTNLNI
ncbi:MAG: efflux RND transporter permease subunit [Saprospiraceae bacterium]|nr:efflux RND transporter permease subunit [Saprospiraceae bacterium]